MVVLGNVYKKDTSRIRIICSYFIFWKLFFKFDYFIQLAVFSCRAYESSWMMGYLPCLQNISTCEFFQLYIVMLYCWVLSFGGIIWHLISGAAISWSWNNQVYELKMSFSCFDLLACLGLSACPVYCCLELGFMRVWCSRMVNRFNLCPSICFISCSPVLIQANRSALTYLAFLGPACEAITHV